MRQFTLLVVIFLCGKWAAAQCLTNNGVTNCPNNTTISSCPTWDRACNGWIRSHGTPNFATTIPLRGVTTPQPFVLMVSNTGSSGGARSEGIYTAYQFIAGNNYDLRILFNFYGNEPGSVNVYAASNVTSNTVDCQDFPPTSPLVQNIYSFSQSSANAQEDGTSTFQAALPYGQVWIYPTAASSGQVNMAFTAIFICPSCLAVVDYTSGSTFMPPIINGKDITIECPPSVIAPTTVEATDAIYLKPGFQTNNPEVPFIAEIVPCNFSGGGGGGTDLALGGPDIYDTINMIDPAQLTTTSQTTGVKTGEGNTINGSGSSSLQVLPTISNGTFLITGSPADLENALILVADASGRTVYRLQNGANTTVNLNLGPLGNGLYFIQINNGVKTTTQKVIINR